MKCAIYTRISTGMQEAENQLIQLKDYCKKSHWNIFDTYVDVISGKEDSRKHYDRLFDDAHKKLFDVVLFWSLDRFSRSGTLFTLQKLKELENLNINWHSYTEPYFSSMGEWKDVVISVLATVAKIESQRISERTKAGLHRIKEELKEEGKHKAKSGRTITRLGRPSIPDDAIDEVKRLLREGKTYVQISDLVTYKTKYGKVHHISPSQICQIKKSV